MNANMSVVHSIINGDDITVGSEKPKVAMRVAA